MITQLTSWDTNQIAETAHDSMKLFIGHYADIRRIADTLCGGSLSEAFGDIIEKGILELLTICNMDEDICKQEEVNTMIPVKEVWRD